jgi:hypothetical protein
MTSCKRARALLLGEQVSEESSLLSSLLSSPNGFVAPSSTKPDPAASAAAACRCAARCSIMRRAVAVPAVAGLRADRKDASASSGGGGAGRCSGSFGASLLRADSGAFIGCAAAVAAAVR